MSYILSLKGNHSELKQSFFPPINLDGDYSCGLISLITYNSIPNIDKGNNHFKYGSTSYYVEEGGYELEDLIKLLEAEFPTLKFKLNLNTLKIGIVGKYTIHFEVENSIAKVFGFSRKALKPEVEYTSDLPVEISSVNTIRVLCNIIDNAYFQDQKVPILHEVPIMVESGYRIVDIPSEIIYLPVNTREISQLIVSLVDQTNKSINFRGEEILIRLHLKKND